MSVGCKCVSSPLREANSAPANPVAVFEGPLRGGEKEKGKLKAKKKKENNVVLPRWGKLTALPQIP